MDLLTLKPALDEKDDPLRALRALAREVFPPSPRAVLRRIAAVGAIYTPEEGLSFNDEQYIKDIIPYFAQIGIPVAPDFELTPINPYRDPERSRFYEPDWNFLSPKLRCKTDLLLLCAVPASGGFLQEHSSGVTVVLEWDAWRKAAQRCEPKLIMTLEDGVTVSRADLVSKNYPRLRPGSKKRVKIYRMGMLAEKSFAAEMGLDIIGEPAFRTGKKKQISAVPFVQAKPLSRFDTWLLNSSLRLLETRPFRKMRAKFYGLAP